MFASWLSFVICLLASFLQHQTVANSNDETYVIYNYNPFPYGSTTIKMAYPAGCIKTAFNANNYRKVECEYAAGMYTIYMSDCGSSSDCSKCLADDTEWEIDNSTGYATGLTLPNAGYCAMNNPAKKLNYIQTKIFRSESLSNSSGCLSSNAYANANNTLTFLTGICFQSEKSGIYRMTECTPESNSAATYTYTDSNCTTGRTLEHYMFEDSVNGKNGSYEASYETTCEYLYRPDVDEDEWIYQRLDACYANGSLLTFTTSLPPTNMPVSPTEEPAVKPTDEPSIFRSSQTLIIDCSTGDKCSNTIINSTGFASLVVKCNVANACQHSTIYCPVGDGSECFIQAKGGSYALKDTTIYAMTTGTLDIDCIGYSNACKSNTVYASYAKEVTITCGDADNYACDENNYFHVENATSVTLDAYGKNAFYLSHIYASYAKSFKISCSSGKGDYACIGAKFYVPPTKIGSTKIYCYGHGCYKYMDIYTQNIGSNIVIKVNGCGICDSVDACILSWDIKCGSSTDDFYGDYCAGHYCDCDDIIASFENNENDDECTDTPYTEQMPAWVAGATVSSGALLCACIGFCVCMAHYKKKMEILEQSRGFGKVSVPLINPLRKKIVRMEIESDSGMDRASFGKPFRALPTMCEEKEDYGVSMVTRQPPGIDFDVEINANNVEGDGNSSTFT